MPQWNQNCLYAILLLTSTFLIGQAICSDNNNNVNADPNANSQRRQPASGSGGGTLEKRSSYAVISQAMSDTINSEFGSEYEGDRFTRASFHLILKRINLQLNFNLSFPNEPLYRMFLVFPVACIRGVQSSDCSCTIPLTGKNKIKNTLR